MGGTNNQAKEIYYKVLTEELSKVAEPVLLLLITSAETIDPVFKRRPGRTAQSCGTCVAAAHYICR
ncbi:hypothetical protein Tco_0518568, partial [Tanacetum coccineum]